MIDCFCGVVGRLEALKYIRKTCVVRVQPISGVFKHCLTSRRVHLSISCLYVSNTWVCMTAEQYNIVIKIYVASFSRLEE